VSQRWNLGGLSPTRYGSLESMMAAIAALNAHGTRSYGDLVLHQILGPENGGTGVSTYAGADGRTMNGRGATMPGWFRGGLGQNDPIPPFCLEDDVPDRASDIPFGREVSHQHCHPKDVTTNDEIALVKWMTERTAFWGYRFDDVKGMYAPTVATVMNSVESPFYAEYFDGNPDNLDYWATSWPMQSRSGVEEFTLHFRIQAACNGYDATQFDNGSAGYWQQRPDLAVGFVDNPDTDTSAGQAVIFNKGIAYAYLLTLPLRLALVYGKDYFPSSVWNGAYGLKPIIDNLCWISRTFAFGNYQVRWVDKDVHVASRDGNGGDVGWSGGLLTAVNFNTLSSRTVTCQTPFGPHRWLHDYTGHHGDIWTDANGNATFTIPSNAYSSGVSFLCFAPGGVSHQYPTASYHTTQAFFGDQTLDVMPALNGAHKLPQRLYCKAKSSVSLVMSSLTPTVHAPSAIRLEIVGPDEFSLGSANIDSTHAPHLNIQTKIEGWHTLRLTGNALPAEGIRFTLRANYLGK
jgi:alpha-amylase